MRNGKWILLLATAWAANPLPSPREARAEDAKLDFDQLVVAFGAGPLNSFGQSEELKIESSGKCWYRSGDRAARGNEPARSGAVIRHMLSPARIERLNRLLKATDWLAAEGGKGPATHTDAGTVALALDRGGKKVSLECHGQRPEPYAALLHELAGLAIQERRIYLHDFVSGREGTDAWQEVGRELDALRGGPYAKSPFDMDYERYRDIARRTVRDFYNKQDDELIPAVRLVAYFKMESELRFLHQMAHDRSSYLRKEIAIALGRIHSEESLPVLVGMMEAGAGAREVGFELIQWGDDAVADIVNLIALSTDKTLGEREHVIGENMIRAYLEHWKQVKQPIDARVVAAVRNSLDAVHADAYPRTTYHKELLHKVAANSDNVDLK